jgi:hypothetical protein
MLAQVAQNGGDRVKGRMISRIGTLLVIALLIWRMAGAPGLGDGDRSGLAAGGYVAEQLDSVIANMRAGHGTSGPGIHPVTEGAAPESASGVSVMRGR